jgi:histidinol-phosphate aminotransferase
MYGASSIEVPLDLDAQHDVTAMADAVTASTRVLLVCNPNNPTGIALAVGELDRLLSSVPSDVCVVVDEAYREFVTHEARDETVALLDRHPNLLLLRTFSKVYGLAGLRIGYALCASESLRAAIDRVRQPFSSNLAGQAAALASLRCEDGLERRVEATLQVRDQLTRALQALDLAPLPSESNFVLFRLPDGCSDVRVARSLRDQGIVVRAGSDISVPGALRVTCGTADESRAFTGALARLLARSPHVRAVPSPAY